MEKSAARGLVATSWNWPGLTDKQFTLLCLFGRLAEDQEPMSFGTSSTSCDQCSSPVVFHVHLARDRTWVQNYNLCDKHIDELLARHFRRDRASLHPDPELDAATPFDIELLVVQKNKWDALYYLREEGGTRYFWSTMGYCESAALYWNLQHAANPRPGTHEVLANTITTLGGTLQDVIIDRSTESESGFRAFLRIPHAGRLQTVDVRPSDAINLAIVCKVPIWVSKEAFAKLRVGKGDITDIDGWVTGG